MPALACCSAGSEGNRGQLGGQTSSIEDVSLRTLTCLGSAERGRAVEATAGVEPANEGFADPCLTTWLRRPKDEGRPRAAFFEAQKLERETGLEPATPTLARLCSTTELFPLGPVEDSERPRGLSRRDPSGRDPSRRELGRVEGVLDQGEGPGAVPAAVETEDVEAAGTLGTVLSPGRAARLWPTGAASAVRPPRPPDRTARWRAP